MADSHIVTPSEIVFRPAEEENSAAIAKRKEYDSLEIPEESREAFVADAEDLLGVVGTTTDFNKRSPNRSPSKDGETNEEVDSPKLQVLRPKLGLTIYKPKK